MDNLTKKQRSYCMSQIRSRNTKIEIAFKKHTRKMGLSGWRTKSSLVGKPDFYFPKKKIAVFIDGCFWHRCPECFVKPKSKNKYWNTKIKRNVERDKKISPALRRKGVTVIRFWEHEIKRDINRCFLKLKKIYEKNL